MNKNRLMDIIVVVFCLSGAIISLNLFRMDLFQTLSSQNTKPVGSVTVRSNNVQRRFSDRVLWGRLFVESPVYLGDLIRVAELSSATLHINDSDIDIKENTIIRILGTLGKDDKVIINLDSGSLSTTPGEGIELNISGKRVTASPGAVINASARDTGTSIWVSKGSAVVTMENGHSELIDAGEVLVLDTASEQRIETITALPELELIFESITEAEAITEPELQELTEPAEIAALTPPPPPPPIPPTRPPEPARTPVRAATPPARTPPAAPPPRVLPVPENTSPANRHQLTINELRESLNINFSWSNVPDANAYIFNLYREDANGRRQLIQTSQLEDNNYTLEDLALLDHGTFIWNVEAVRVNAEGGSIETRGRAAENSFVVEIPPPAVPEKINIEYLYEN
ncbi:MAG: hypothetical protein LBU88_07995 [Treponema sp.]|jgi:hypothetical protein|nr:hypothetical protein [Treponema sp.]